MKTYVADTPLNSASITPKKDFVILGGGQAAMDVTTTSTRQGKFEARFYHKIFEEEIGRVRGHFGPLNVSFPSAKYFSRLLAPNAVKVSLEISNMPHVTSISTVVLHHKLTSPFPRLSQLIPKAKAMHPEEKMDMYECTNLTRRTLISHTR
jgi:hypothetical protein